jgi:ABC-type microcin C transport system permease subunit YejE
MAHYYQSVRHSLMSTSAAYVASAVIGVLLWVTAGAWAGKREAWDSEVYWTAAYPVAFLLSVALGFLTPRRPWRWGLTLMVAQAVTMASLAADFSLLPLGVMIFAVLSVPLCAGAGLGAMLQRWRSQRAS